MKKLIRVLQREVIRSRLRVWPWRWIAHGTNRPHKQLTHQPCRDSACHACVLFVALHPTWLAHSSMARRIDPKWARRNAAYIDSLETGLGWREGHSADPRSEVAS